MKKTKKKNIIDYGWIGKIIILSFTISVLFSFISEITLPNLNIFFSIIIALVFIIIGIIFDMVGVSVAASDESKFNSMSSQKVKGATVAVRLKKNADKVSSFCNDVVGDICGIVSGATGTVISLKMVEKFNINSLIITLLIMGVISALTIGGKAMVKGFAMKRSNDILYRFACVLSVFYRK